MAKTKYRVRKKNQGFIKKKEAVVKKNSKVKVFLATWGMY